MKLITAAVLLFSLALPALADGPCKADMEKFCKGIQPGDGRIHDCMKAHEAELSAECKSKRETIKAKIKERREARKAKRAEAKKD